MMKFPFFPKRKADAISNGVFLVLLGILFYTNFWWPGILFALGLTFAIRQYLTGRRLDFFITLIITGILVLITFAGHIFSMFFPLLFIAAGIYLIAQECLSFKSSQDIDSPDTKNKS